ncbi:hypothetical protein B7494_g5909 [Chlorociboria aeruginascens]|nr:hypothetical protein B7494_g5909 [Chlorociboria aeruginascens]
MLWKHFPTLALSAHFAYAQAMLRFPCSQLVVERLDPVGQPGSSPSGHLHQVAGGNSFNTSMIAGVHDPPTLSTCTSCTFSQDFSNYWTASLYFKARNGTFKRVPQMANEYLTQNGGLTVYYIPPYDGVTKVTAFQPGFRMLVGNYSLRTDTNLPREVCHRCFGANFNPFGGAPCTGDDTVTLPTGFCAGGIRTTITFPTGTFESGGPCPSTHPVKLPQLMYEVMWDTTSFNDASLWPTDGSQPFVYSMGDPSGYGQHGDYIFGWQGDALQNAMNAECDVTCSVLQTQSDQDAMACTKAATVVEEIDGWLDELPGSVPITGTSPVGSGAGGGGTTGGGGSGGGGSSTGTVAEWKNDLIREKKLGIDCFDITIQENTSKYAPLKLLWS